MKKVMLIVSLLAFISMPAFGIDLDQAYRKNFGEGTILVTNGEYPPVGNCNPSQFDWKAGTSRVVISFSELLNFRAILPNGKRFNDYYQEVVKNQGGNLGYKTGDILYWQLWTDRDENGNILDQAKNQWPKSTGEVPDWKRVGWFTSEFDGEWDTIGLNNDAYRENLLQYFSQAQKGQKFYLTLSIGYRYMVGAGEPEQKWNPILKRTETVISTGELGFAVSEPFCAGTIEVKENKN